MPIAGLWIGERVRAKQQFWKPFLQEWAKVLDQYARVSEGDLPQWKTERPKTGFLAAAAWCLGSQACALEEYNDDWPEKSNRRVDLWIRVGNYDASLEVKCARVREANEWEMQKIKQALKRAEDQVKDSNRRAATCGVAACLASIEVAKSEPTQEDERTRKIAQTLVHTFRTPQRIVAVSCLPSEIQLKVRRKANKFVPAGMALVGSLVWQT